MSEPVRIDLDRTSGASLTEQIHSGLRAAIADGTLAPRTRLPSWQDLAAQLGVSRGTVKRAYERLGDAQLVETKGAAGTWIAPSPVTAAPPAPALPLGGMFYDFEAPPRPFQMGIPAQDQFPLKAWSGAWRAALAGEIGAPLIYGDPRGSAGLRREIAGYLAMARGIHCTADQVLVTSGFAGALGLTLQALGLAGETAWVEEPGYPRSRTGLLLAGVRLTPVPVDEDGLDVEAGIAACGNAAMALVTPGQQAPLGMTMSLPRRRALLAWAERTGAWIVEDDFAGELQLHGRATPALAALDRAGRVIHIGTFSKTLSPSLRLGFVVLPPALAGGFADVAAHLAPAGGVIIQNALQHFMASGQFLRHLRRMKRHYLSRRTLLARTLQPMLGTGMHVDDRGGLSVRLKMPDAVDDVAIAGHATSAGLAPVPLSHWYQGADRKKGLLLGMTNIAERSVLADCRALVACIRD